MFRKSIILILFALLLNTAWAVQPYHEVQVVDETGAKVTTITSVSIYAPDSTTDAVIYMDRGEQNTITIPMTTSSTNTTLSDGLFYWYGPDGYNFSITDGSNIANNADHRARTSSEGRLFFPSYLTAISSTTYTDAQSATFGTGGDWVLRGGNVANQMSFTPIADNSNFIIGVSGTTLNSDFNVYVGTALGLKLDAGDPSLTWDGGAVLVNHDSNFNVGINTGTSTGNSTIGSSTSGTVAIDTTAGITVNADDSIAVTTSAGTIDIDSTGGDFGIDATDKSVLIDAGESATDAMIIQATGAAGGVELISGTGDITLDSGDDIFLEADTGVGDVISIVNTQGTAAGAILIQANAAGGDLNLDSVLGRIEIEAEEDVANALYLIADGATASTIQIFNDTGTSVTETAASIQMLSDVGGISLASTANLAKSIQLVANGGTTETIYIQADQGDGVASINVVSDAGGITLNAAKPVVITNAFEPDIVVVADGAITILANNSGQDHLIPDLTGDQTVTMPAEADGMYYKLVYIGGAADAQDWLIDTGANANFFIGGLVQHDPDNGGDDTVTYYSDGNSNSKISILTPAAGTIIEMWCDGTNWRITGTVISATDAGVVFADQ